MHGAALRSRCADLNGDTSGPTRGSTQSLEHRGAILELRYHGAADDRDAGAE
jgi:hypothetical protein